ncbi:hypothetical protein ACTID9_02510 [Brevibacillus fluminis]|uniref:hypothetical protein n=1 Tax=Brevibacillus fluminis TaxID=511487 RepID=UPI003F8A5FB7
MMKNLLYFLLVLMLPACGTTTQSNSTIPDSSAVKPSNVWIQKYRDDTQNAQPELINSSNNEKEVVERFTTLTKENPDKRINPDLATDIYLLKFEALKDKSVVRADYYHASTCGRW